MMRLPRIRSRDSTTADDGPTEDAAGAGSSSPVVDTAAPTTDTTSAPSNGQQQQPVVVVAAADGSSTPLIEAGQRQAAEVSAGVTPAAVVSTTTIPEVEEDQHVVDLEAQEEREGDDEVSRLGEADATIAQAWMAKRREQIQGGNSTNDGKSTAVDVDTLSRWFNNPANNNNNNNNVYPQSADYLSTRRVHGEQRISPYHHHEYDAESSLSSWSIRTDKTPIVSNRVPGAIPRPRPLPRLTGAGGGGEEGPVSPSPPSPTPVHQAVQDPPHQDPTTPVPPPRTRGQDLSCRDVFDYSKWHGKVLYGLIFLLLISLVTVVTTAVFTGGSRDSHSPAAAGTAQVFGGRVDDVLSSPSVSPSVVGNVVPFASPAASPTLQSPSLSPSPTYASVVTMETSAPMQGRGIFTAIPTAPTSASTALQPSAAPVLAVPLFAFPTTGAPSVPDTLVGLADNFEETFRFDHGAASLALSQNGLVMAISDDQFVKIYEFAAGTSTTTSIGSAWHERGTVPASDGTEVVLNADGSVLAVSLPRDDSPGGQAMSGMVRVYQYDFAQGYRLLGQELEIGSAFAYFGSALALSLTGLTIAIGAPFFSTAGQLRIGQARVYQYEAASIRWVQLGAPLFGNDAQDWFGTTVAIVESSSSPLVDSGALIVAIGAPHSGTKNGYVQTYAFGGVEWEQYGGRFDINNADLFGSAVSSITDSFGSSMSLVQTVAGLRIAVGAPAKEGPGIGGKNTGMVAVFDYNGQLAQWTLVGAPIVEGDGDRLGSAVTLLHDGKLLVVGSEGYLDNRGAVRFYRFNGAVFVSDVGGPLQGSQPGEFYGSSLSATIPKDAPYVSLAVSANKRSDVSLLEQKGRPLYR